MPTPTDAREESTSLAKSSAVEAATPYFVYPLLAAAIVAVSSAAVVFSSMSEIPPFLLASWRLQITALLLLPSGVASVYQMPPNDRWRMLRESFLIGGAGVLLGAHFGSWVMTIESTSLTHALLVGSTPPIMIAVAMLLLRKPISLGEIAGTAIAALGGLVISQSASSEKAVTVFGDCMGLISSALFVVYLAIGRAMRGWLPTFAYVLPVNALAALTLCCGALAVEGAKFDRSASGLFGYMGSWQYLWRSLYLGAIPGILGHVSFNALLKWLHPLVISLPGTTEPVIGSLLGLAFGIGTVPGLFTYLGGSILIGATVLVILSAYKREQAAIQVLKLSDGSELIVQVREPVSDAEDAEIVDVASWLLEPEAESSTLPGVTEIAETEACMHV